jgi:hypothetical protein
MGGHIDAYLDVGKSWSLAELEIPNPSRMMAEITLKSRLTATWRSFIFGRTERHLSPMASRSSRSPSTLFTTHI